MRDLIKKKAGLVKSCAYMKDGLNVWQEATTEEVVGEGTIPEEEASETKVSKEDAVEEDEEAMVEEEEEEVSFPVDQRAQTHGTEEKDTKGFLKTEAEEEEEEEEEEEDVVGPAAVVHLDFAFKGASIRE